jgi:prepilin peptidase CpaA
LPTFSDLIVLGIVAGGTGAAAAIDLRTRRVPNALTLSMTVAGLALAVSGHGRVGLAASLAGCVLGAALMLPGHVLGATGAGDVKLMAASGALLGPSITFRAFVATLIAGGAVALIVAARRRRMKGTFAYAPAIAMGVTWAALGL